MTKFKWAISEPGSKNQRQTSNELLVTLIREIAEIFKIDDEIQMSYF